MHKWSPDNLVPEIGPSTGDVWNLIEAPSLSTLDFVEDNPRSGAVSHMNRLSQEERDAVYVLVEERIRADVEKGIREKNIHQDANNQQVLSELVKALEERVDEELHRISCGAVELAIAISEQIVRGKIGIDHESMISRIATIIQHVEYGAELKVIARPGDMEFLRAHMQELEHLNVKELVPNPNLSPGSCLVTCEGREWDLTIEGQVSAMAEMVREAILSAGTSADPSGETMPREVVDHDAALV